MQDNQKVCLQLMITIQSSGTQILFDHPVYHNSGLWAELGEYISPEFRIFYTLFKKQV